MDAGKLTSKLLQVAALLVVVIVMGGFIYRLEQRRDRDMLTRAGAKMANREDGSVMSITLPENVANDEILGHVAGLDRLVHLQIEGGDCSSESLAALSRLQRLRKICFYHVECTHQAFQALEAMPKLEQLTVRDCAWFGDADLQMLDRHPKLSRLALTQTSVTDAGLAELPRLRGLTSLVIARNKDVSVAGVASLVDMPQLKLLNLENVEMSSSDLQMLLDALPDTQLIVSTKLFTDMQPLLACGVDLYESYSPQRRTAYDDAMVPVVAGPAAPLRVNFQNCQITQEAMALLHAHAPELEWLRFENTNVSEAHLKVVEQLTNLAHLTIMGQHGAIGSGIQSLRSLPLTDLNIFDLDPLDGSSLQVIGGIRSLSNLWIPGPTDGQNLIHLGDLENLTSLGLFGGVVSAGGLRHLVPVPLHYLSLHHVASIDDDVLKIIGQMSQLRGLSVIGAISDAEIVHLNSLTQLRSLGLRQCELTGRTLGQLMGLSNLRSLDVMESKLNDAGLLQAARLTVTVINASDTDITRDGIEGLHQLRPDIQVFGGQRLMVRGKSLTPQPSRLD